MLQTVNLNWVTSRGVRWGWLVWDCGVCLAANRALWFWTEITWGAFRCSVRTGTFVTALFKFAAPQNSLLANSQQKPFGKGADAAVRNLTGLWASIKCAEDCEIGRDWNQSSQCTLSQGNDFGLDGRRNLNCSSYQRQFPCLLARSLTIPQYFISADVGNGTV